MPVGVAGAPAAATAIERQLAARDGAFETHRYADEAAAREAIEDREVYGAFVATPAGPKVLTATRRQPGGGPAPQPRRRRGEGARRGRRLRQARAPAAWPPACCRSCSPGSSPAWPRAALGTGALQRAGLVVGGSILAGLTATAIIQSWLDVVGGDWLVNAGALSLTVLAIAAVVAGLETLLGKAGAALAALTMVLIGNPFSGVATGPEMLPSAAGWLGQLLPPGAGGNLLRSTGLFDGAAAGGHVAVLAFWALAGLALLFALRRPQPQDRSGGRAGRGLTGSRARIAYQRSGRRVGPTMWPPPAWSWSWSWSSSGSWLKCPAYQTTTLVPTIDSPLTKASRLARVEVATAPSSIWPGRWRSAQKSPTP